MANNLQKTLEEVIRVCSENQDWVEKSSTQLLTLYRDLMKSVQNQNRLLVDVEKESLKAEMISKRILNYISEEQ